MKAKKTRRNNSRPKRESQPSQSTNRGIEGSKSFHGFRHINPLLTDVVQSIQDRYDQRENKTPITGISTGFNDLDRLTGGFRPGELIVLTGPPSTGKTTLALNIASNIAVDTHLTVGVFSLGLRGSEIAMRMMLSTGKLDSQRTPSGCLNDDEWSRLSFALGKLHGAPIFIDETSGITIEHISSKARCLHQQCGRIGLIVVEMDKLLYGSDEAATHSPELKEIKLLAKELDTPIIVISQLHVKTKKRKRKRPTIRDLQKSGITEQDADMVLLLFRKHLYSRKAPTEEIAECIVLKQRDGPPGTIKLAFMKEYLLFESLADRQDLFADDLNLPSVKKSVYEVRPEVHVSAEFSKDGSSQYPNQHERPDAPQIAVFSEADVAELEKTEPRERSLRVAKKLRETAGVKPLAILRPDWREMLEKFEADFPNFGEFVEFLRDQFALSDLGDKRVAIPPVLFNGPPGIGKTEVALSLAALIDTDSMVLDMAVAQTGSALSGSEVFWSNSREGRLFEVLAYGRTANPVAFLDELDKVSNKGDAALYQLLEPRTAESFRDLSIPQVKLNASQVIWFAATNDLERVNAPIRSRFVVFNIPLPTLKQTAAIAHTIYRQLIERNAWGTAMASDISDAVANRLTASTPRVMRTLLSQACGRAARQGRRDLMVGDVCLPLPARKAGIGFVHEEA